MHWPPGLTPFTLHLASPPPHCAFQRRSLLPPSPRLLYSYLLSLSFCCNCLGASLVPYIASRSLLSFLRPVLHRFASYHRSSPPKQLRAPLLRPGRRGAAAALPGRLLSLRRHQN